VNLTKFGAFVSVLPGRDACCTSRSSRRSPAASAWAPVEDVLSLGQDIEVRVDDIDPQGKGQPLAGQRSRGRAGGRATGRSERPSENRLAERREPTNGRSSGPENGAAADRAVVSFEDAFEAELVADLGDLGPGAVAGPDEQSRRRRRRPPPLAWALQAPLTRRAPRLTAPSRSCPAASPGHRDHGGCPLGVGRFWVGAGFAR